MSPQELANKLNSRQLRSELTKDEEREAKAAGLAVVFGASDDLMEFRGAVYGEIDCYDGGTAYLDSAGLLKNECENEDCPHEKKKLETCKQIEAVWGEEGYSWTYKTDIPHATFEVLEDEDKYCRGIVFHIEELI